jgi:hypothetical protein
MSGKRSAEAEAIAELRRICPADGGIHASLLPVRTVGVQARDLATSYPA